MSYKITFRDKSEVIVPQEMGEKLKASMLDKEPPEHITLAGELYKTSQIISVTKSNIGAADMNRPALPQGPQYNCAQFSIQKEIHRRALQHRNTWPKLVRDPKWREKTRLEIRAEDPKRKWCDHHANEHACLEVKV